jgi:hypothetical protein
MSSVGRQLNAQIDAKVRRVLMFVWARLTLHSPVGNPDLWTVAIPPPGYVGGHFRANWQLGAGVRPAGVVSGTGNPVMAELPADRLGGVVYHFVNNVDYAERLENGYSSQAPAGGIVALTATETRAAFNL